jgi:hypothetical protein
MFKTIWNWIKIIRKQDVLPIKPIQLEEIVSIQSSKDTNTVYLNDPTTPQLIREEMCVADSILPMIAVGEGGLRISTRKHSTTIFGMQANGKPCIEINVKIITST